MPKFNIRGTVLAFAPIEVQDGKTLGIILVERSPGEWVTAWYREGDREWFWGHYSFNKLDAQVSFVKRVAERLPRLVAA